MKEMTVWSKAAAAAEEIFYVYKTVFTPDQRKNKLNVIESVEFQI